MPDLSFGFGKGEIEKPEQVASAKPRAKGLL